MNAAGSLFAIVVWLAGTAWYTRDLCGLADGDDDVLPFCKQRGIPIVVPCLLSAFCAWPWFLYIDVRAFALHRAAVSNFRRMCERAAREAVEDQVAAYEARLASAIARHRRGRS